ncbi:hypothetical protein G5I_01552 [Acromyrmex echinatior]|uniref:Uncharacterized protein n=1 Tax=Acromyrmex echinatior TaxID=103372 RepID=F4W7X5_ACREC|nr:hypothetical protein G5I_01552 [Acromyrmex echinatior]
MHEDHCPRGIKMEERMPSKPSGQYGSSDRLGLEIDLGKNPPVASSPSLLLHLPAIFLSSSSSSRSRRWSPLTAVGRRWPLRRTPVFAFVLAKKDQVPWRGCEKLFPSVSLAWSGSSGRREEEESEEDDEEEEDEEGDEEENETKEKSNGKRKRKDEKTTTTMRW